MKKVLIFLLAGLSLSQYARASCTNPDAEEGTIIYNSSSYTFQGCTPHGWYAFHHPLPLDPCPASGLVAHYRFDETGGTTANDSSGNNRHGTLVSMDPASDWVTGPFGNALDFDGGNDRVNVPSNAVFDINVGGGFSNFLWFKKTTDCGTPNNEVMTNRFGTGHFEKTWWLGCSASTDFLSIRLNEIMIHSSVAIDDGKWHHAGWIYEPVTSQIRLYLDGTMVNSTGYVISSNMNVANPLCISGYDAECDDPQYHFQGTLDDVRFYNRALTSGEISTLYGGGLGCR